MTDTTTRTATTPELRKLRDDTRDRADSLAWTLDRLKRQTMANTERDKLKREWQAADVPDLRRRLAERVQALRAYADNITEQYPEAFDATRAIDRLADRIEAGDTPGPEELAEELRFVARELRGYVVLR